MAKRRGVKRKLTVNQAAEKKQIARINRAIKRIEKRGFELLQEVLPSRPSRVTKQYLEKLSKVTPEFIYKKSRYVDFETGEVLTGVEGRKLERSKAAKKGIERKKRKEQGWDDPGIDINIGIDDTFVDNNHEYSKMIIDNWKDSVSGFNERAVTFMYHWLNNAIERHGIDAVADALEKSANEGYGLTRQEAYDLNKVRSYMQHIMDMMEEYGDFSRDEFEEALEEDEYWFDGDN